MKKILYYFAVSCWIACLIVHSLTFADIDVRAYLPGILLPSIAALLLVCLPSFFSLQNNADLIQFRKSGILNRMNPVNFFKILFKGTPVWLSIAAVVGFYYACANGFLSNTYMPEETDGKYFLMNHGQAIKTISRAQYLHYKALETRLVSGHFSGFLGISVAVLYPFKKQAVVSAHQPPAAGS